MQKEYWIGDLCYVVADWSDFCEKTIVNDECLSGDFTLAGGIEVSFQHTKYGDGVYKDRAGNDYPVDAGLIGVIAVDQITNKEGIKHGHVHKFSELPSAQYDSGMIIFDSVVINTGDSVEEDDEYYDEDDE